MTRPVEVRLNRRGCKKPLTPRTARALARLFKAAHAQAARKQRGKP